MEQRETSSARFNHAYAAAFEGPLEERDAIFLIDPMILSTRPPLSSRLISIHREFRGIIEPCDAAQSDARLAARKVMRLNFATRDGRGEIIYSERASYKTSRRWQQQRQQLQQQQEQERAERNN